MRDQPLNFTNVSKVMKTSITKSSDKENVAKISRPFDKVNTLYSKLDFLFKKIHQPIFFVKGYPHGLPLK